MTMSDQRWKRQEREVAALLGGVRLPNSGRGQPDVIAGTLAIQVKTTKALPAWLTDAVDQATRDAGADQLPSVVLNAVSQGRRARRLVVFDLDRLIVDKADKADTDYTLSTPQKAPRADAGDADDQR